MKKMNLKEDLETKFLFYAKKYAVWLSITFTVFILQINTFQSDILFYADKNEFIIMILLN